MEINCEIGPRDDPCGRIDIILKQCYNIIIKMDKRAYIFKIAGLIEELLPIMVTIIGIIISVSELSDHCYISGILGGISVAILLLRPILNFNERSIILKHSSNTIKDISRRLMMLKFATHTAEKLTRKINKLCYELDSIDTDVPIGLQINTPKEVRKV